MEKHEIAQVEARLHELHTNLENLTAKNPVLNLIDIMHRPGFTSPAEAMFLVGMVEAMHAHVNALASLKETLITAASRVHINPQPLPP